MIRIMHKQEAGGSLRPNGMKIPADIAAIIDRIEREPFWNKHGKLLANHPLWISMKHALDGLTAECGGSDGRRRNP